MMKRLTGMVLFLIVAMSADFIETRPAFAEGFLVKEGEAPPDFTLPDQEGKPVTFSALRGEWVVPYFYSEDATPGCTKEACSFRDNIVAIQHLNTTVLGVSVDSVAPHKKFSDKNHLNFQILAEDPFKGTRQYGPLTKFMEMDIARRKGFPAVEPADHTQQIHQTLKALQGG